MIDEADMELIRIHKQMRKAKYEPKNGFTPIPLEFLDTKRKTIMEFHKGKSVVKEDDWRSGERPTAKSTESWKGRTIFRIPAGGIESRTVVPAKVCDPARGKMGSPEDIVSRGKPEDSSKRTGAAGSFPQGKVPVRRRVRTKGSVPQGTEPKVALQLLRMIRIFKTSIPLFRETRTGFHEEHQRSHR